MTPFQRPLPEPDDQSAFYWQAAREHRLAILRCRQCGRYVHYPRSECPACHATGVRPAPVSGQGRIHSYTVTHYVPAAGLRDAVPFVVALVELVEQTNLRIIANLRECAPADVRIGMPVEVFFEDVTPEVTLPQVRPRQ